MASSSSSSGPEEINGRTKKFPQFDVATDYSDHKYVDTKQEVASGSPLYKTIMKEWKILQESLPETIYVRVYDTRLELMRAVIVGPLGTPYHDGLFFFDILFPSDYPNNPPTVSYWSFGYQLNPNLNADGTICLSLLNTWDGEGNEKWVPEQSTVLQLLVSLQALVLNEMPFFNESDIEAENDEEPTDYNDEAFVLSCKTMVRLLKSPLKNFESLIREHFRDRSRNILTSCQAYLNGFLVVGQYQDGQAFLEKPVKVEEESLRKPLEQCFNRLATHLKKNDASVEKFLSQLTEMVETTKGEYKRKKKEKKKRDKSRDRGLIKPVKKIAKDKSQKKHKAGKVKELEAAASVDT